MSAVALLDKNSNPTRSEVKEALAGNLCYCIDYTRIVNTILAAAGGS
jgi:aerobic-type carbon monoxide dehydrogenase small subunit (CoxS/CutS family)